MAIPQQLGQYRIEAQLTSDRYAESYRALDTVRRRTVLLRLLRVEEISNIVILQRFLQHAERAADLVHPRLAWVWESSQAEGYHYLVERFVNGPTLEQRLVESGPLGWDEAQTAISQLAQGLDFAHGRGFDLGAVRPKNILLSPELGAVLGGLGLALGLPSDRPIDDREEALCAAPELWQGRSPSPASDQYALACILAEMLSGRALFDAPSIEEIHARHLSELQLPHTWPDGTPWQVELALERALSKEPAERYANAAEFAETPGKLALRSSGDEQERSRRAALAQARKQTEEQAHRVAEEAARLAALEQARRELEEQLRYPAPLPTLPESPPIQAQPEAEPLLSTTDVQPPSIGYPSEERRTPERRRNWIVWAIGVALILALAALWLSGRLPGVGRVAPTATATQTVVASSTGLPTSSPSPMASSTQTATATASHTPTRTRTPTRSSTATLTPTATQTQSPTPVPTTPRPTRDLGVGD
jgi:eukaryotic-like serine/threonine-protein kinase